MFCASQNLLAGKYRDDVRYPRGTAEYRARKEDTDNIFDDALTAVGEIFFYASPLLDEWVAPEHSFLLPEHAPVIHPWTRRGPAAITRAWCLFEIVKCLAKGCPLHVVLRQRNVRI